MDIKVRDYAADHGLSAEAIYKKIRRKPPELDGHVHRHGNATWLDDAAQAYLTDTLARSPIVISDGAEARKLEKLQQDNNNLQAALIAAQQQIIAAQQQLVEAAGQQHLLAGAQAEAEQLRQQVTDLQAELAAERGKSIIQRIFGKQ